MLFGHAARAPARQGVSLFPSQGGYAIMRACSHTSGPIAQRLEQGAHNSLVAGSIPAGPSDCAFSNFLLPQSLLMLRMTPASPGEKHFVPPSILQAGKQANLSSSSRRLLRERSRPDQCAVRFRGQGRMCTCRRIPVLAGQPADGPPPLVLASDSAGA